MVASVQRSPGLRSTEQPNGSRRWLASDDLARLRLDTPFTHL
jgi:hypothetical protein